MALHNRFNHRIRALACALLAGFRMFSLCPCAVAAPGVQAHPVADPERPSLNFAMSSNASGIATDGQTGSLECDTRIEAGGADIRLWVLQAFEPEFPEAALGSPAAGLGVSLPYLRFGTTKPVGLAAFVHAPASADTLLLGHAGAPLVLDDPADPACLGVSLGDDYGLFMEAPVQPDGSPDLGRTAWGPWYSPRGGFLSALALVSGSPADAGGPGWYDVPAPLSKRGFAALSGAAAGSGWALAAAAAGSLGFPGEDAAACRAEARVWAGGFRFEAEGSAASAAWGGSTGTSAPFLRIAADARYARLGYAAALGFRYVQVDAPGTEAVADGADVAWSGSLEARSWFGQARASASLQTSTGAPEAGAATAVEVDTRWKPGFAPWLALASSWRAAGSVSERLDLSAQASFGKATRFLVDSGLRFVPEGRLVKGSCSIARTMGAYWAGCSVQTAGWVDLDTEWLDSLAYSLKVTATLK